jgi:hypothetical protein
MNEHNPARPAVADQRATLRAAAVILADGNVADVHAAAASAGLTCPACATVAAVGFGFALAQELAGAGLINGPLRARIAAALDGAERQLDAEHN